MMEQQSDTADYYIDLERQFANCSRAEVSGGFDNYVHCSSREYNRSFHRYI